MNTNALIFDLDGTLIDSVEDIGDAMNAVLSHHRLPTHSYEAYRRFVGRGLKNLAWQALPESHRAEPLLEQMHAELMKHYTSHPVVKTRLYPGILELLQWIRNNRIRAAILSNKADSLTQIITEQLGIRPYFDFVLGNRSEFPRKPDPTAARHLMNQLNCAAEQMLYIGDSGVDMQTAANCGIPSIGVTWGFRSVEELVEQHACFIAHSAEELQTIIAKQFIA